MRKIKTRSQRIKILADLADWADPFKEKICIICLICGKKLYDFLNYPKVVCVFIQFSIINSEVV
jgi:hypothetical protein